MQNYYMHNTFIILILNYYFNINYIYKITNVILYEFYIFFEFSSQSASHRHR